MTPLVTTTMDSIEQGHADTITHIKLHITEFAGPARPFDFEDCFSVCVHDGEPGVDESAILLDVAHSSSWGRLDLHLLQAAETAPGIASVGAHQVNDLDFKEPYIYQGKVGIPLPVCISQLNGT